MTSSKLAADSEDCILPLFSQRSWHFKNVLLTPSVHVHTVFQQGEVFLSTDSLCRLLAQLDLASPVFATFCLLAWKVHHNDVWGGNFWTWKPDFMHYFTHRYVSSGTLSFFPRIGELRMQKFKSHLVRTQSLNVLPFKPGVGQYIAIHATLTARAFFLAFFYPSSPFTCIFSKTSPIFFLCWPAE